MLDFINKGEYFSWLEEGVADSKDIKLKGIQDAWILSILKGRSGLKIAEVGGGISRVLKDISDTNECWNIDKFEGSGKGPRDIPQMPGVKVVQSYLGDFDPDIPDNYFDVVFSVSVVEHVPESNVSSFFADCYRILKPGGVLLHAIDLYISDIPSERVKIIDLYRKSVESMAYEWLCPPVIDSDATFRCSYASNSDLTLNTWNQIVPSLKPLREQTQSVSIKLFAFKDASDIQTSDEGFLTSSEITLLKSNAWNARTKALPDVAHTSSSHSPAPEKASSPANQMDRAEKEPSQSEQQSSPPSNQALPGLASSPLARILSYYSRWPIVIAAIATALCTTAFLIDPPFSILCSASGALTLLFLVGHAASKADYALAEAQKVNVENQKSIAMLDRKVTRMMKRQNRKQMGKKAAKR